MDLVHTIQCDLNFIRWTRLKAAYAERWPEHCTECLGRGRSEYDYDPSPTGASLGSGHLIGFEPCVKCYEKHKCPRCAKPLPDLFDPALCPHCGWIQDETAGLPSAPKCFCHK